MERKTLLFVVFGVIGIFLIALLIVIAAILLALVVNNKQKTSVIAPPNTQSPPPQPTCANVNNRRGILIGFDGTRQDALRLAIQNARTAGKYSNFLSLIDNGAISYRTYAGGHFYDSTQQITMSGPGWTSVLTGVWNDQHKVVDNEVNKFSHNVPTIFNYVKNNFPNQKTVACVDWDQLDILANANYMGKPVDQLISYTTPICPSSDPRCNDPHPDLLAYVQNDVTCVANVSTLLVSNQNIKFIFLYIGAIDETGHYFGFSPNNSLYMSAIETAIAQTDSIVSLVNARRQKGECWLIGFANDHGGHNKTHGSQNWTDREITSIFQDINGTRYSSGNILSAAQGQTTTTATFLDYFGLTPSQYPIVYDRPINGAPIRSIFVTIGQATPTQLKISDGMPQPTSTIFRGLSDSFLTKLSSAFVSVDRKKVFFFTSNGWYARFDLRSNTIAPGYPRRIWWDWKGITAQTATMILAAVSNPNMDYYFFLSNGSYIVNRAGAATAHPISRDWPGLGATANQITAVHAANLTSPDSDVRYQFLLRGGKFLTFNYSAKQVEGGTKNLNNLVQGIFPYYTSVVASFFHPIQMSYYYFLQSAPFN